MQFSKTASQRRLLTFTFQDDLNGQSSTKCSCCTVQYSADPNRYNILAWPPHGLFCHIGIYPAQEYTLKLLSQIRLNIYGYLIMLVFIKYYGTYDYHFIVYNVSAVRCLEPWWLKLHKSICNKINKCDNLNIHASSNAEITQVGSWRAILRKLVCRWNIKPVQQNFTKTK